MASGFIPANTTTCDECHPDLRPAEASYRLEIQKNLCPECAIKHQDSIKGLADKVKWTCQKHTDRKAELFCLTHDYPICHVCAVTTYHTNCNRYDIDDMRKEREKQLMNLIRNAEDRGNELEQTDMEVDDMSEHLTMIMEQVSSAAEEEVQKVIDDRDQTEKRIKAEYDEHIEKLNEEKNERLKCTRDEAQDKIRLIWDEYSSLEEQIHLLKWRLREWKPKLMPGLEELATNIRDVRKEAKNLIINQGNLMRDFHDIIRQMDKYLDVELNRERLDEVKSAIGKIEFSRGKGLLGTVEGLEMRWFKVRDVTTGSSSMIFLGCIGSDDVITRDPNYVSIMRLQREVQEIIKLQGLKAVCYNSLPDGGHVFGTIEGKLMLYDQFWNYARTIPTKYLQPLLVTVDKYGVILAAEYHGSTISVFKKDGKCLKTIIMADGMSIKALKTMSTGDVIILTEPSNQSEEACISILDQCGIIKSKAFIHERNVQSIAVDMSTDRVYILSLDLESHVWVVNEVLLTKSPTTSRILEWDWDSVNFVPSFDVLAEGLLIVRHAICFTIYERPSQCLIDFFEEL